MASTPTESLIAHRYELAESLGRGGMAEVHAAIDRRLQRPVAVKTLYPEMAARADIRTRFESEARAAARLSHPNAVAVFDTGEHQGVPFIVMERLPGETLADRMAAGPVDPDWLRRVAGDTLGALAAAHEAGIVHRDVKPPNILIAEDGCAKVADFGIAKSIEADRTQLDLTTTGQLVGTPAYLSPERLGGEQATPQADIYALGVVLYEALAGRKPFTGDTPVAQAIAIQRGDHVPLPELRPDLDPSFTHAVETAMATDPARRFASAGAMVDAVALQAGGVDADATVADDDATQVLSPTAVLDAPAVAAVANRRTSPNGLWILAATAGAVLLLLLIAAVVRGSEDAPTSPSPSTSPAPVAPSTTAPPPPTTASPRAVAPPTSPPRTSGNTDNPGQGDGGKGKGRDEADD